MQRLPDAQTCLIEKDEQSFFDSFQKRTFMKFILLRRNNKRTCALKSWRTGYSPFKIVRSEGTVIEWKHENVASVELILFYYRFSVGAVLFVSSNARYVFVISISWNQKTMNQWWLIKGVVPSQCLYSVHSTTRKPRKEPKPRSSFHLKNKLNFSSTNTNSVSDDWLNASSCSNIVEEPKFKSIEVQTDFSYVHALIYFPSEAEVIVNQDHSYSVLPTVCNELAAISMSFNNFEKKVNTLIH